jgi:hypothetical protein
VSSKKDQEEEAKRDAKSRNSSEDRTPCLCQKRVMLEVDGDFMTIHTLYNWGSTVTLVRDDTARGACLLPI